MKRIIFFDGVCNLCNGFVSFMVKIDKKAKFHFAPIQGEMAKKNNLDFSELAEEEQSIVYIDADNSSYQRSDAVIQIFCDLLPLGKIFLILKLIPRPLRDGIYKFVAKNRYKIFGKKMSCRITSPLEKERFLD